MTAKLKEVANPKNFIVRSVKFFYPVNVDEKDAVGAKDYHIEAILGEKRRGRHVAEYLVHFSGYGAERAEWTAAKNVSAKELVEAWNKLLAEERKSRTVKALEMQAKDSPSYQQGFRRDN